MGSIDASARGWAMIAGCAALGTVLSAGSAIAACESISVQSIPDTREAHFVDKDGSGNAGLGDMRNGVLLLQNADGKPIGAEYWLATVDGVDADGKPTSYNEVQVFVFEDGAVFTSNQHKPAASFDQTETTIVPTGAQRQVVGGTGAYGGARGTMETSVDGLDFTFRIDVTCE